MELIYGLAGVLGLGIFAAFAGFDAQVLPGLRDQKRGVTAQLDDPNSTLSITREVLAEKLDPRCAELLLAKS